MTQLPDDDHNSDAPASFIERIGKAIGLMIGIPLALLFAVSILGEELATWLGIGKLVTGNATDCQAVEEYLDEAALDYEKWAAVTIDSATDWERMTDHSVRHVRGLDPHEDVEDFHIENLKWWLYLRDDFPTDVQRTLDDDEAFQQLMEDVSDPIWSEFKKLRRECPLQTRNFEQVLEHLAGGD